MFHRMRVVGLALLAGCLLLAAGRALAGDGVVTHRAVIVGISDFEGTGNDLTYCDDDATELRQALLADPRWQSGNITLLLNTQGTKANIQSAISAMAAAADNDDLCLFFFSGHGGNTADAAPLDESDGYDEYLCPYNITTQRILDDELAIWLTALPTAQRRVIIDSCYSGGMTKAPGGKGARVKSISSGNKPGKSDGFAADLNTRARDMNTLAGLVCLMACNDDEYSYEGPEWGNGAFTYYLLDSLKASTDTDGNGEIAMEESYAYLSPRVVADTDTQHPQLYDGNGAAGAGLYALTPISPASVTIQDGAENGNGNGEFDPGERIRLTVSLANHQATPLAGVSAALLCDTSTATVTQALSDYPPIAAGGSANNATPFIVTVDLNAPLTAPVALTLSVTVGGTTYDFPIELPLGHTQALELFGDTLEGGAAGWSHNATTGIDTWALVTPATDANAQYAYSPTHCWRVVDYDDVTDQRLVTPAVALPAGQPCFLVFRHTYAFESGYDGGIVEISTNGTTYTDLGPYLTEGGYTGTINASYGNPLGDVASWTGGVLGAMTPVRANLSSFAGETIRIRFRAGSDSSIGNAGWYLDNVVVGVEHVVTTGVAALQVTAPAPAFAWRQGESRNITWLTAGNAGETVKLELLKGGALSTVIAASTSNDGSHSWRLPDNQATGVDYRVKVTSLSNAQCWDATNRNFTVAARTFPTVALAASPVETSAVGAKITLTASLDPSAPAYHQFFVIRNGVTATLREYDAATTCEYTPTEAGEYQFIVWAREPGSTANYAGYASLTHAVTATNPPLTAVGLAATPASPCQAGAKITLTATPNTTRPVEYRFFKVFNGVTTTLRGYAAAATVDYTPTNAGTYQFIVWSREVGSSVSYACYKSLIHTVTGSEPPLTAVNLTAAPGAPSNVGTTLTLTATPDTGRPVEYRFFKVFNGVTTSLRGYATAATVDVTPTETGSYQFIVWAREVGQNVTRACYKSIIHLVAAAGPPLTTVTLAAAPTPGKAGVQTTLTATPNTTLPVEYRFFVSVNGGAYTQLRVYQTNPQYVYTPPTAGNYTFLVWARQVGHTNTKDCYKTLGYGVNP